MRLTDSPLRFAPRKSRNRGLTRGSRKARNSARDGAAPRGHSRDTLAAMVADPSFRCATLSPEVIAAYRDAPSHLVAEIVNGALSLMPRPRPGHATTSTALGGELWAPFQRGRGGPGGWIILDEPELRLGPLPDVLVPDLAAWRRERVPAEVFAPGAPVGITIAPDWVCEVLSPSTEAFDRAEKMPIYAREGVCHAWLVDPELRTLEVFELAHSRWTVAAVYRGSAVVRATPFDAIEIDLTALWEP